jgi:hypothetical protein
VGVNLIVVASIWASILLLRLGFAVAEAMARRRAMRTVPPAQTSRCELRLLVEEKEGSGLLWPTVDVGAPDGLDGLLRVDVVDETGTAHPGGVAIVPAGGPSLLTLPFAPPPGTSVADVLAWRWRVVLEDRRREVARWEGRLWSTGPLSPEAELELVGRE